MRGEVNKKMNRLINIEIEKFIKQINLKEIYKFYDIDFEFNVTLPTISAFIFT
jgi:hypothetical protein